MIVLEDGENRSRNNDHGVGLAFAALSFPIPY